MKVSAIIKSYLAISCKQGEAVRDKILEKIVNGKRITLDCCDITCISSQFFYPIAEIHIDYSENFLKDKLRIINLSKFNQQLLQRCINEVKEENSKQFNNIIIMKRPDLNILRKQVYEANKAKGFHDREHTVNHLLCLVVSELMEVIEADRKGRQSNLISFDRCINGSDENEQTGQYMKIFDIFIKDTVADELADAVIRLLDLAGCKNYKIIVTPVIKIVAETKSLTENIWAIITKLVSSDVNGLIYNVIYQIETLSAYLNIDIWKHIDIKLKYNSMRDYKHGKKY